MNESNHIFLLVEGPTEKTLSDMVLAPAAAQRNLTLETSIVRTSATSSGSYRGGGGWRGYHEMLRSLLRASHLRRIGLLIDYYQYPRDAPGRNIPENGVARQSGLIDALRAEYPDPRFCPLVVLHEIEALVLAAIDAGHGDGVIPRKGLATLRREIVAAGGPESVNNGKDTAPSKRLTNADPHYSKTVTGPDLIAEAGLDAILERCPTFASWWWDILS